MASPKKKKRRKSVIPLTGISPKQVYGTPALAQHFGVDIETLHKKYIHTKLWAHHPIFRGVYTVPGWSIIRYVNENLIQA